MSYAHSPNLATFQLKQYNDVWMLEGSFAFVGLDEALKKSDQHRDYSQLDLADYKSEVMGYIRSHINLSNADGSSVTLGDGGIKLGDHQTDVRFVIEDDHFDPMQLTIKISCMSENANQQNVFLFPKNLNRAHQVLSAQNNFTFDPENQDETVLINASALSTRAVIPVVLFLTIVSTLWWVKRRYAVA